MTTMIQFRTRLLLLSFAFLAINQHSSAQQNSSTTRSQSSVSATSRQTTFELEKQNAERVAASPEQIREVLLKDPGLLVELKHLVAKEATANGQLIDDTDLMDQAIFDRLGDDIVFRSAATRLLQRYGYLLPSVNPDSALGKQDELVLKERARRLVQIESQEDARSLISEPKDNSSPSMQQTTNCDSQRNSGCSAPRRSRQGNAQTDEPSGGKPETQDVPNGVPPAATVSPLLRAGMNGRSGGLSTLGKNEAGDSIQLAAMAGGRDLLRSPSSTMEMESLASAMLRGASNPDLTASKNESVPSSNLEKSRPGPILERASDGSPSTGISRDSAQGAIVHKSNPYADIPSLYDMYVQVASRQRAPERFGVSILGSGNGEPNAMPMDLPAGPDYVVGPGDGLAIDLWGGVSQRMVRVVDREGRISLPEAGPLLVSGKTLGEVQMTVQQALRMEYRDVSADVSLSRLRTIRVYVVGEVSEPGAYDISSLSTPLNAIVAAGGITTHGSLRSLKHYRGKQLIDIVDAYDLLLRGVVTDQKRLENGDSLLVPPVGGQITIEGMVRRPAIYELQGKTTLGEALELAGGILPAASLQHIEVERLVAHQNRTMFSLDLSEKDGAEAAASKLDNFQVQDGDSLHIFPIAPYNDKAIYLQGHVLRPGRYSYHDGMTVSELISSYSDLLPEPAGKYAEIIRLNPPDFRPTVESFDLTVALANPASAPKLMPLDTVRIFSKYDFDPAPQVWVGGEVRSPGQYYTSGQTHFRDAVYLAGGVSPDAALCSAQLFRTNQDGTMTIMSVNLAGALAGNLIDNILLQPRDRLLIQRSSAKLDPATVYIKGEVAKPGRYPLTTNMHVEDLVHVAGGLKRSAYTESSDLMRYPETAQEQISSEFVVVNLAEALGGEAKANLALRDGDVLTIKPIAGWSDIGASVTLRGELQHPGAYGIRPGERLSMAVERAGGFTAEAYPYGAVLLRREVRDLEIKSHGEMIARIKAERVQLKVLPEGDAEQKNVKLNALAQTDATLNQLIASEPIGRVVIHVQPGTKEWKNTAADVPLRNGDILIVPKKRNYVVVNGQVFNPTAIGYQPGLSAKWYLSQAGGLTPLADKNAVFVIRADGSVISAKNNGSGWWLGDPMNATLRAGDTVVVPEKAVKVGGLSWIQLMQAAQIASSIALAVTYLHP
jgi:protein involved in polysaccharide export with SLBB domain